MTESEQGFPAGEEWNAATAGRAPSASVAGVPGPSPPVVSTDDSYSPAVEAGARIEGVARSVQYQQLESRNEEALWFRVERYDSSGNPLDVVAVELRGFSLSGRVRDGERVEVVGRWVNGTLEATDVFDRTTGAQIRPQGVLETVTRKGSRAGCIVLGSFFALIFLIAVIIFAVVRFGSRTVPDVVGLDALTARSRLSSAGFDFGHQDVRGNELCLVLRQDPAGNTKVGNQDDVTVHVVAGPSGNTTPPGCR